MGPCDSLLRTSSSIVPCRTAASLENIKPTLSLFRSRGKSIDHQVSSWDQYQKLSQALGSLDIDPSAHSAHPQSPARRAWEQVQREEFKSTATVRQSWCSSRRARA